MNTKKPALRESFGKRPQAMREIRIIELLEQLVAEQRQTNVLLSQQQARMR